MSATVVRRCLDMLKLLLFGETASLEVPVRVSAAIERQQAQSEILIGWVQLGVAMVFGTLYGLSPKTFDMDVMFAPVPWALAAYLAFTIVRLSLGYRGSLTRWFLTLSVIMDMALLIGLIWSFHIQYEQPAAFVLKVATLIYVFIFIALRPLRFDAVFVLLYGLIAAIGWFLMLAVSLAEGTSEITRYFVLYMTSTQILLGAEFDKIMSILVVTLILALAIVRARRLLVRSIAEVANQITKAEYALSQVMESSSRPRCCSVIFEDLHNWPRSSRPTP